MFWVFVFLNSGLFMERVGDRGGLERLVVISQETVEVNAGHG